MREIDPEVVELPEIVTRTVTCEPCGMTWNEDLNAHLARVHPNGLFPIDVDPAARTATIRRPAPPIGFFNKFGA